MKNLIFFLLLIFTCKLSAADFSETEKLQGFKIDGNKTYFVFDAKTYKVNPKNVSVTGSFIGWNSEMKKEGWVLSKTSETLWLLEKENPDFELIAPMDEFKFRINEGEWLNPPQKAKNIKSGNLVFAHETKRKIFKAEIVDSDFIRVIFDGYELSYNPKDYLLKNPKGEEFAVKKVFYEANGKLHLVPAKKLDKRRVFYVTNKKINKTAFCSFDGWFRHLYSGKELGANYSKKQNKTWFRIFAPRATKVKLYLYKKHDDTEPYKTVELKKDENCVWEFAETGNLHGTYYDYTIHGFDDPGNHFYETNPVHVSDPYARVNLDTFGKCRVWNKTKPAKPLKNGIPKMKDVIAYEVHVQDFTTALSGLPENKKGTFEGFFQQGLKNKKGEKIGFDHIVEFGANVVHLQPVQEFLHFPNDVWQKNFLNDKYFTERGINKENYQWGYRTSHALAVETRYRTKGTEFGSQNEQFRDLVQAFHNKGIAVIADYVFNHTAERMDLRNYFLNFSVIDQQYYYRNTEKLTFIGEYGTETKSEDRPMVARWIVDQCKIFINEFGIDGFRIDLAGQTDEQTLKLLVSEIGKDKIVYGEPWIASADPNYENNPDWDWYKEDAPITFFQDDSRNAFCGPPSNPENKQKDRGFAGGNGEREQAKKSLSKTNAEDKTTTSGINYLDIHDNWALADRFAKNNWDGRQGIDENRLKIAATLLFTSLGPIVLHGGTEFLRSKASAPLEEKTPEIKDSGIHNGPVYLHGKRDTYNLRLANEFNWETKGKTLKDGVNCDYKGIYEFW
ncbi:pullulanase, partial [bacterium]|nr:pullulanase [bacterium]